MALGEHQERQRDQPGRSLQREDDHVGVVGGAEATHRQVGHRRAGRRAQRPEAEGRADPELGTDDQRAAGEAGQEQPPEERGGALALAQPQRRHQRQDDRLGAADDRQVAEGQPLGGGEEAEHRTEAEEHPRHQHALIVEVDAHPRRQEEGDGRGQRAPPEDDLQGAELVAGHLHRAHHQGEGGGGAEHQQRAPPNGARGPAHSPLRQTNVKLLAGMGTRSSRVRPWGSARASSSATSRTPQRGSRCRRLWSKAALLGAVCSPSIR